ncbi:hypothetical protein FPZ12_039715 [Amycolatopsis acidicola]|uniref:PglD N-terminal domain-containing protein n=1 Tax=Amycolatopsis acidicola TaxID=2596893 RepID=A0A5N0UN27_9PSEU|nr:NeuD/PglB/VioB family sugar acetyltransferase [Amycolatopsis acidicola]KAA9151101.1 hypothetical protein FPZ12_039715 [Amycolatopsis acidicola]
MHAESKNRPEVVIIGAGDLARQISGLIEDRNSRGPDGYELKGFLDKQLGNGASTLKGYPILGSDEALKELDACYAIGVADPVRRQALDEFAMEAGRETVSLIHDSAYFECGVTLAPGAVITQRVHVEEGAAVGRQPVFNVNCLIGQDAVLGDYVIVAPHAIVGGRTRIGSRVLVGMGAIVLPDLSVGDDAVIGAGSVVTRDVPVGTTVAGVPARPLRR